MGEVRAPGHCVHKLLLAAVEEIDIDQLNAWHGLLDAIVSVAAHSAAYCQPG